MEFKTELHCHSRDASGCSSESAEGIVKKYTVDGERSVCYQYLHSHKTCSNHYHLKCEKCGKLIHMECETVDRLAEHIYEHHNFHLNTAKCVFYGICENCKKGEE